MWVIERCYHSNLHYWNAGAAGAGSRADRFQKGDGWTTSVHDAVRFADEESASIVLAYICDGQGRVCEHSLIDGMP